jgi:hypothetical protein
MIEATCRPPVLVPPERARYSREHVGSDYIGWLHFQPIYDRLVQTENDMLDWGRAIAEPFVMAEKSDLGLSLSKATRRSSHDIGVLSHSCVRAVLFGSTALPADEAGYRARTPPAF